MTSKHILPIRPRTSVPMINSASQDNVMTPAAAVSHLRPQPLLPSIQGRMKHGQATTRGSPQT
eukprot:2913296-Amphidinium_carterae.1